MSNSLHEPSSLPLGRIFRYLLWLYRLGRGSQEFLDGAYVTIDREDPASAASLRKTCRMIVRLSVATLVFGLIVVPCAAPWFGVWGYGILPADAPFRMLIGLIISFVAIPMHLYAGVAAGCLLAPRSFLEGVVGGQWLEVIGTESPSKARVVCVLVVVVALAGWGVIAFLQITAAPFVH